MSEHIKSRWELDIQNRERAAQQAELDRRNREYLAQREASEAYLKRQAERKQREMNRAAYYDRLATNAARCRQQYTEQFSDLVGEGLEQYLPNEFTEFRNRLTRVDTLLANSQVEEARDLSVQLGSEIHSLATIGRSAKREFELKEQQRQAEIAEMQRRADSEIQQYVQNAIIQITDPIVNDFAYMWLKELREKYVGKSVCPQDVPKVKDEITQQIESIKQEAEKKAAAWKERKDKETRKESQTAFIEQVKQNIEADKKDNPDAVQAAVNALEVLKAKASENTLSMESLQEQLTEETDKADGEIADETVRREVVKSIYKSLKQTGFIVDEPTLEGEAVIIRSKKPAGNQAAFTIQLDGNLTFKFDNYEGQKCKKDIDEVTQLLNDIYGVKLSDKKVFWENPDRLQKGSKEFPSGGATKTMNK